MRPAGLKELQRNELEPIFQTVPRLMKCFALSIIRIQDRLRQGDLVSRTEKLAQTNKQMWNLLAQERDQLVKKLGFRNCRVQELRRKSEHSTSLRLAAYFCPPSCGSLILRHGLHSRLRSRVHDLACSSLSSELSKQTPGIFLIGSWLKSCSQSWTKNGDQENGLPQET